MVILSSILLKEALVIQQEHQRERERRTAARIPDNEMSNENEDEHSNDRYRIVKIPSAVAGEFLFATKVRRRRT